MPRVAKLAVVREREGNPRKTPIPQGVRLQPKAPPEPDWKDVFPGSGAVVTRCREVAGRMWALIVTHLDSQGIIALPDEPALRKLCVYEAIFDQATRDLTQRGFTVKGQKGETVRNPALMSLSQASSVLPALYREFGMTPLARDRLNPRDVGEADSDLDV